ncbi:hypothetical protein ACNQFZ_19840 [Schinkia sp. CFF1]
MNNKQDRKNLIREIANKAFDKNGGALKKMAKASTDGFESFRKDQNFEKINGPEGKIESIKKLSQAIGKITDTDLIEFEEMRESVHEKAAQEIFNEEIKRNNDLNQGKQ